MNFAPPPPIINDPWSGQTPPPAVPHEQRQTRQSTTITTHRQRKSENNGLKLCCYLVLLLGLGFIVFALSFCEGDFEKCRMCTPIGIGLCRTVTTENSRADNSGQLCATATVRLDAFTTIQAPLFKTFNVKKNWSRSSL